MFQKKRRLVAAVAILAAAGATAGLLASVSRGAATTHQTIGLVLPDPDQGAVLSRDIEPGARAAASALGDDLIVKPTVGADAMTSAIESLIAQHVGAIIVNTDEGPGTVDAVLPALAKARAAGIPTLSYEQQFPGSVWVTQSTPDQYAHALADALATQLGGKGQYVIVSCTGAESVVDAWLKVIKAYVPQAYPAMKRVGVVYGDTGNGDVDTHMFRRLIRKHPHLRGMIFLCPGESYTLPPQVIKAHKVGKVFSAGNGGDCPPVYIDLREYVRAEAEEIVCAGDPLKLGYLVVWAADYLANGHRFGQYEVGGPVGSVQYFSPDDELPLGQPLTLTKANVDQYGCTAAGGAPCPAG